MRCPTFIALAAAAQLAAATVGVAAAAQPPSVGPALATPNRQPIADNPTGITRSDVTALAQTQLATEFIRAAVIKVSEEPLSVEALETAAIFAEEAVQLAPNDAEIWRLALGLAMLAEREELKSQSLEKLSQLDPSDDVVRLVRLNAALDERGGATVEQRVAAYQQLLARGNEERLGRPVASRLALDLALLERRRGNVNEFSKWLSQALAWDSSNRTAAALATGFFRMNVKDAIGEAELLLNLLIADPTGITTQVLLGQLLLENGAYVAAERMYQLAMRSLTAGYMPVTNDFVADLVVAQWARGDHLGALESIRKRQAEMDAALRDSIRTQDPERSLLELAKLSAPMDPTLATVRAVILGALQGTHEDNRAAAAQAAVESYRHVIQQAGELAEPPPPAALARAYLEMAWVMLWLNWGVDEVPHALSKAQELQPLSQQALDRFEGWLALRRGEIDKAIELLTPIAPNRNGQPNAGDGGGDVAAGLGLAIALLEKGQKREAATEFLKVNRAQPGSLMGIWAANRLSDLLGQRISLSAQAAGLEELIASLPRHVDRFAEDPSQAIGLRILPSKTVYAAYEPIMIEFEITNRSPYPLAIDRDGPIRHHLLISPVVRSADAPQVGELKPFIVDIGRRLTLAPRDRLIVTIDLRRYISGGVLNALAVGGSLLKVTGYLNFVALPSGHVEAGLYGRKVEGPRVHVEGARVDDVWMNQSIIVLQQPHAPGALERMALVSHLVAQPLPPQIAPEQRRLMENARLALAEAFAQLDPVRQAWLLTVMRQGEGVDPVLAIARKSEHRLVKLAFLLSSLTGADDPMINAARRGDDPVLRRLADLLEVQIRRASEAAADK